MNRGETDEHLLRELTPQVLAAVTRRFGDFAAAEDAVQEALVAAATQWPERGRPDDPRAWLIHVAARRYSDRIRSEVARRRREGEAAQPLESALPALDQDEAGHPEDTPMLLFMCCHPSLSRSAAIALTLRAVGGLTTGEIARAYLVPEATMAQRITRAKRKLAEAGARFDMPSEEEFPARLRVVLHVLYLVFNEGYASGSGEHLIRADLSREAIRLMRLLRRQVPDHPEATGLLALMLLTDARRPARTDAKGGIVPLDEQNRTRWDRGLIDEGVALVTEAMSRGAVGPYQVQAAIAAVHDEAPTADDTDWTEILALYGVLLGITSNPMVVLNHAIALAMVQGPAAGLARLVPLDDDPRIADHHRLAAVRAHLYERLGDHAAATTSYRLAARRTTSASERDYLLGRAAELSRPRPPSRE